MNRTVKDQYNDLKSKTELSTEESAVVSTYEALQIARRATDQSATRAAQEALEDAQADLVATPSTTV